MHPRFDTHRQVAEDYNWFIDTKSQLTTEAAATMVLAVAVREASRALSDDIDTVVNEMRN